MPIIGIGMDLLEIFRMEKNIQSEHFVRRVFTEYERAYIEGKKMMSAASASGIFCAKEAFIKSVGRPVPLGDISVMHRPGGQPYISLSGKTGEDFAGYSFLLSITHTDETAGAVVVCESRE